MDYKEDMSVDDEEYLTNVFVLEAVELLESLKADILAIGANPSAEHINRIFRAFHTLKGNSHMMGFRNFTLMAHKSEDILHLIRSRKMKPDAEMLELLLGAIRKLTEITGNINDRAVDAQDSFEIVRLVDAIEKKAGIKEKAMAPDIKSEAENKELRILIVDDEMVSRIKLEELMSKYGRCNSCVTGEEAIEAFKLNPGYDIICMDIMMPGMTGTDAAKEIRAIERDLDIPYSSEASIIMISAIDDVKAIMSSLYECGASAYIVKPVDPAKIQNEMKKLCFHKPETC